MFKSVFVLTDVLTTGFFFVAETWLIQALKGKFLDVLNALFYYLGQFQGLVILLCFEAVDNESLVEVAAVLKKVQYIWCFIICDHNCGPVHLLQINILIEIRVCLKQKLLVIQHSIHQWIEPNQILLILVLIT